jgi:HB1, ASXL, restriction endonuclease HTH domain
MASKKTKTNGAANGVPATAEAATAPVAAAVDVAVSENSVADTPVAGSGGHRTKKKFKKATTPKGKTPKAPKGSVPKAPKADTPRTKKDADKPRKRSALDAAARVLKESGQPMNCQDMIQAMAAKGYWTSPAGKTPAATLYSAIMREIKTKGNQARFQKTARGHFVYQTPQAS